MIRHETYEMVRSEAEPPRRGRTTKLLILLLCCLILPQVAQAVATGQISQYGITWTFDRQYEYGQFANGDYWVVGPVTIISIDPPSTNISGRIKNGSMINPSPLFSHQGYDNTLYASSFYDNALNVAYNVSPQNSLVVPVNSSLVSAISIEVAYQRPQLYTAAILTVLQSPAPVGSFRPPYSGADKSIKYNKSQLNYLLLKKLAPVAQTPLLSDAEILFERPWIDHYEAGVADFQHPLQNMPHYGQEIGGQIGLGALMLNLNFSDAQKEKLLIRYTQLGIDYFGVLKNGGSNIWYGAGGHASGRKLPILFAGLILNEPEMKDIGKKSGDYLYSSSYGPLNIPPDYIHFGEDDQTFYVTQLDVDITHSVQWDPDSRDAVKTRYETTDLGLPEWGIWHAGHPEKSNAYWYTQYRVENTAVDWGGFVLTARIMGAKEFWNHNALFDYMDRYMSTETGYQRQTSLFVANMWDAYRADYGPIYISLDTVTHKRIYSGITYGDVSGDGIVNAYDAALVAQAVVGLITLTADQAKAADVSGDSIVSAYDAALIAQYAVGLINKFPAG